MNRGPRADAPRYCGVCGQGATHVVLLRLIDVLVSLVPVCAAHARAMERGDWALSIEPLGPTGVR